MYKRQVYNFARIAVSQNIGSTTAAVMDNVRILPVWAFFLVPFGEYLCRVQGSFHYTATIGLVMLMVGIDLYYDIIIMPTARNLFRRTMVRSEFQRSCTNKNQLIKNTSKVGNFRLFRTRDKGLKMANNLNTKTC